MRCRARPRSGTARNQETETSSTLLFFVQVFTEVEEWVMSGKFGAMKYPHLGQTEPSRMQEETCTAAANLAGQLQAKAIFVYTRTGKSADFVSRRRPDAPIIAITGALRMLDTVRSK
jgi:pyruvate kinase